MLDFVKKIFRSVPKVPPIFIEPLDFNKYPKLSELRELGASNDILRTCQKGFEIFQRRGWTDDLDQLQKAFKVLLSTNKVTSDHFELPVSFGSFIRDHMITESDEPIPLNLEADTRAWAKYIKQGRSANEIWRIVLG